jgi:hypothetical protein
VAETENWTNGELRGRALAIIRGEVKEVPVDERTQIHFAMTLDIFDKLNSLPLMWIPLKLKRALVVLAAAWATWVTLLILGVKVGIKDIIGFITSLFF